MTAKLLPVHLADIQEVFVCKEPDSGGETFVRGLLERLRAINYRGRAWVLPFPETFDGCKDPADLHKADPAQFPRLLQDAIDRLREQEPDFPAKEPGADREPALIALDISDLLLEPSPPKRYLFRKLITSQSLGMLYGFRGYGKSYCVHNIAFTCASGGVFLGFAAETPVRTLLIDGELPINVLQERFAGLIAGADGKEPPSGYLRIVVGEKQGPMGIPDLAKSEGQKAVESILGDSELLILDNLSALVRSGVENEGESWLPIQNWLLSLRRRGVAVLIVHHANKAGGQRGSSRREDCLDYVLCLKRGSEYDPESGCAFQLHFEKARGLWGRDVRPIDAKLITEGSASRWTWNYADDSITLEVADMAAGGMSLDQIGKALGMAKTTVYRRLEKAKKEGLYQAQ